MPPISPPTVLPAFLLLLLLLLVLIMRGKDAYTATRTRNATRLFSREEGAGYRMGWMTA